MGSFRRFHMVSNETMHSQYSKNVCFSEEPKWSTPQCEAIEASFLLRCAFTDVEASAGNWFPTVELTIFGVACTFFWRQKTLFIYQCSRRDPMVLKMEMFCLQTLSEMPFCPPMCLLKHASRIPCIGSLFGQASSSMVEFCVGLQTVLPN